MTELLKTLYWNIPLTLNYYVAVSITKNNFPAPFDRIIADIEIKINSFSCM